MTYEITLVSKSPTGRRITRRLPYGETHVSLDDLRRRSNQLFAWEGDVQSVKFTGRVDNDIVQITITKA